jgi:integrase
LARISQEVMERFYNLLAVARATDSVERPARRDGGSPAHFSSTAEQPRQNPRAPLRHGCGYALANAGHDTRALQAWLGHRNIQHTVRYTEVAPDRFKNFWRD